jgi:hypothetical protein
MNLAMASKRRRPPRPDTLAPTLERLRHAAGDIEIGDDKRGNRIYAMRDAPLERLRLRGRISQQQYDAGAKFRHHWYHAGMAGALRSTDLDRIFADGSLGHGMPASEAEAFHRGRYREAVLVVGNGVGILEAIACNEQPPELVGYKLGWRSKPQAIAGAIGALRSVLDTLCRLWGLQR